MNGHYLLEQDKLILYGSTLVDLIFVSVKRWENVSKSILFSVFYGLNYSPSKLQLHSLVLEVLNQALHVLQLSFQLHLLISQPIELSAQVRNVGLKHGVDVRAGGGLFLEETPFGLQHLVLLFQEAHLGEKRKKLGMFLFMIFTIKLLKWVLNVVEEDCILEKND